MLASHTTTTTALPPPACRDASKQELRRLNMASPDFTAFLAQQAKTFPGSNLHDLLALPVRVLPK